MIRAEFYTGQRVTLNAHGQRAMPRVAWPYCGIVHSIIDLRHCIPPNDPKGTRDFALRVKLEGRKSASCVGNGAYFTPEG